MTGWSRLFCLAVALLVGVPGMAASPDQPRPDPQLTPSATLAVTTADICVTGYTKKGQCCKDLRGLKAVLLS